MDELLGVFLEGRDGIEGEFVVCGYLDRGARYHHGSYRFIGSKEVLGDCAGNGDEVRFEVVGVADDK